MSTHSQTNWYLTTCARNGDMTGVCAHFLDSSQCERNNALVAAAGGGHLDIAQYLLEQGADPCYSNSVALTRAAAEGFLDIVAILLPVSDLAANSGEALANAAFRGKAQCLKFLLPFVDLQTDNGHALESAVKGLRIFNKADHHTCIDLLLPVTDVAAVLQRFESNPPLWEVYNQLWAEIIAQQQANALNAVIVAAPLQTHRKI